MSAVKQRTIPASRPAPPRTRRLPAGLAAALRQRDRAVYAVPLATGLAGMVVAFATMFTNATDALVGAMLLLLAASVAVPTVMERRRTGRTDRAAALLAMSALVAGVLAFALPAWIFGFNLNGIISRTVFSGPALLILGTGGCALAIRRLLAAYPSGADAALVPVLLVPVALGLAGYAIVVGRIVISGIGSFSLGLVTTAYAPSQASGAPTQVGFLNNILGTFLLIGLTLLIAILPGVGAGVFMSEYPGRIAAIVRFCATMLRAIAMFIIGAAAFGLVGIATSFDSGSIASQLIRGAYADDTGVHAERGSFLLAATVVAMLVIPVIARLTEEGLRSVPREIREGAVALGATEGYSLRRILLPWAAPNILTALILAGAEAAGSLAIVMFVAGTGERGVGPLSGATTLDFAVFATRWGPRAYFDAMKSYQFVAALLLLVLTVCLSLLAMALQRRFAARYRGSITA